MVKKLRFKWGTFMLLTTLKTSIRKKFGNEGTIEGRNQVRIRDSIIFRHNLYFEHDR
jgi:hypothetical protein